MAVRFRWMWVLVALVAGPAIAEEQIEWQTDIAKAVKQAKEQQKLVLVHFYGDNCRPCRTVEEKVFPRPEVVQAVMRNYVPVKINVNKEEKIAARYAIREIPTDIFLAGGTGQETTRTLTKLTAAEYATWLDGYAIQTGIGAARQTTLNERESQYDNRQPPPSAAPPAQQQYVQNQYVSAPVTNRYTKPQAPQAEPQQSAANSIPDAQTEFRNNSGASAAAQAQVGPYDAPAAPSAQPAQPMVTQGYVPQGGNRAQASPPINQRTNYQDPGDITARQPIRNNFILRKDLPPLGLDGFCPVSLTPPSANKDGSWKQGNPQFGAVHRGRTYLFASAAEQAKFLADPDAYSPVLSGADPVIFAETGKMVDGNRKLGMVVAVGEGNEMYFFATPENLARFQKNHQQYAAIAHQAVLQGETETKLR